MIVYCLQMEIAILTRRDKTDFNFHTLAAKKERVGVGCARVKDGSIKFEEWLEEKEKKKKKNSTFNRPFSSAS